MNDINSNLSFKFFNQNQVFKEIKKLDENKASRKNDNWDMKENNEGKHRQHLLYFIS